MKRALILIEGAIIQFLFAGLLDQQVPETTAQRNCLRRRAIIVTSGFLLVTVLAVLAQIYGGESKLVFFLAGIVAIFCLGFLGLKRFWVWPS